jgi:predicted methyltransferase
MYPGNYPKRRYRITKAFLEQTISKQEKIIDLGVVNPFSEVLKKEGYNITNTTGEDLDIDTQAVQDNNYEVMVCISI